MKKPRAIRLKLKLVHSVVVQNLVFLCSFHCELFIPLKGILINMKIYMLRKPFGQITAYLLFGVKLD